ncbi:hypothetical protein [Paenibacillus sp. J2TS4]|uniref:hypothetical protein n=1 Tax=Paenibacillus sp. J2TS4 TaxID=2807194 RepID=UPI001B07A5E3|nr:hypothetical protein [Paenibacillus sp. J2TS4]GIP33877.1 hypothetical protein J2TS4_30870 [Paenibacillus sp. J2TS4]
MEFNKLHEKWLNQHLQKRTGERRGRLKRGHKHAEIMFLQKVWWPLHGNFDNLHPEYEVLDWRGRPFFIDFAWLPGHIKIALEVKGYGPHVQTMDRQRYCDELNRETFLQGMGFRVLSIPFDDVISRPELTISLLRVLFSHYLLGEKESGSDNSMERNILLLAIHLNRPIRPIDVVEEFNMNRRTAVKHLQTLCSKGRLRPLLGGNATRVSRYELVRNFSDDLMW